MRELLMNLSRNPAYTRDKKAHDYPTNWIHRLSQLGFIFLSVFQYGLECFGPTASPVVKTD
jgi:hypothetical protein